MINYLRSIIGEQLEQKANEEKTTTEVTNDTILEYAGLFQELDDLTGKSEMNINGERNPISIPLEDDIELDSIEMNITDGRVTDIPSDATAQESYIDNIKQQYAVMKTRQDFYNEAYDSISPLPRESREKYEYRVRKYAMEQYEAYEAKLFQEGLFGHNKVGINEPSVPGKITLNFGENGKKGKDYNITLPIKYEVDSKHRITKKQLDTAYIWGQLDGSILKQATDKVFDDIICNKYNVGKRSKWDVITPAEVIIPVEPTDKYAIVIGFETDLTTQTLYFIFGIPVKSISIKNGETPADIGQVTSSNTEAKLFTSNLGKTITKREHVLESYEMNRPRRFGRFYQEAIDFGDGGSADTASSGGENPPTPDQSSGNTDMNVNVDAGSSGEDTNTPDAKTDDAPNANAAPAAVNDVSDKIAQNVANATAQQNADTDTDTDIDIDTDGNTEDINIDSNGNNTDVDIQPENVDAEIDSLDGTGDADLETKSDAPLTDDLDDMTIDELIAQGAEKLKGMTINQLKSFVSAPDGTTPEDVQEAYVQEALLTKEENIKTRLRTTLYSAIMGLEYIDKNIGKWDVPNFVSFWLKNSDDKMSTSSGVEFGVVGPFPVFKVKGSGDTNNYKNGSFRYVIDCLRHFVMVARKKRARGAFSNDQLATIGRLEDELNSYWKECEQITSANFAKRADIDIKEIAKDTKTILSLCKQVLKFVSDGSSSVKESEEYSVGDEEVMMENFFTVASNIKGRIETAIEDAMPGLNKIYNECSNQNWDRYKLREFWRSVRDEHDDMSFSMSTEVRKGNQFRSYVSDLRHYLKTANKDRARNAFTESDLSAIKDCNEKLLNLSEICDKASSKFKIKNDVSMMEVGERARIALEACRNIKRLVTSDEFVEYYIQEAADVSKKNVSSEINGHIKSSLGILNDTSISFNKLTDDFKVEGKRLNTILTKAIEMKNVYTQDEIKEIEKLNSILAELTSNIRINNLNDQANKRIKKLIQDYTDQCKVVAKIVGNGSIKQESASNTTGGNCSACQSGTVVNEEEDTADTSTDTSSADSGADTTSGGNDTQSTDGGESTTECGDNNQQTTIDEYFIYKRRS